MKLRSTLISFVLVICYVGCGPVSEQEQGAPAANTENGSVTIPPFNQARCESQANMTWLHGCKDIEDSCVQRTFEPPTNTCSDPVCTRSSDPDGWCKQLLDDELGECFRPDEEIRSGCIGREHKGPEYCEEDEVWFPASCESIPSCVKRPANGDPPTVGCFEPIPRDCQYALEPDNWCKQQLDDPDAGCRLPDGVPNENGCVGEGTDPCEGVTCPENYRCDPYGLSGECHRIPVSCETWTDCESSEYREPTDDICSKQGHCIQATHCLESVDPLAYCARRLELPEEDVFCDENNDGFMGACVAR